MKNLLLIISVLLILISCDENKTSTETFLLCDSVRTLPMELSKKPRKPAPPTTGGDVPAKLPSGVILLDFDGENVIGSNWNYIPTIVCDSSGLNQQQIDSVVMMVAKRFDSLNVFITTDRTLYDKTLPANRQIMIFTRSNEWYGTGAAGTTFVRSFGSSVSQPGFIFTKLINYSTTKTWKVACHETGHTLGLYHQSNYDALGNYIGEYRPGVMMGNFYVVDNPWWTIGPTVTYTTIKNEMQEMAAFVGWK